MTKEELLGIYRSRPEIQGIARSLSGPDRNAFQLAGLAGSAMSMISAALYQDCNRPFLFLLPDKELASYFLNDLENLQIFQIIQEIRS